MAHESDSSSRSLGVHACDGAGTRVHPAQIWTCPQPSRKERTLGLASRVQWGRGGPKRLWLASVAGVTDSRISRAFDPTRPETLSDESIARIEAAMSMSVAA